MEDKILNQKFENIFFHFEKGGNINQYLSGYKYEIFSQVKEIELLTRN